MSESRDRKPRKSGAGRGGSGSRGGGRKGTGEGKSSGGRSSGGYSKSSGSGGSGRSKSSGSGSGGSGGSRSSGSGGSGRSQSSGSGRGRSSTSGASGTGRSRSTRDGGSERGQGRGQRDESRSRDRGRSDSSGRSGGYRGGDRRDDSSKRGDGRFDDAPQKKLPAGAEGLPRHVVESLMRVTPAARQSAALVALAATAEAFSEGQYHVAVKKALHAKDLASRDATIREILALASYRIGDWSTALRELRTYRRLSGETTHMPVEMDVLRALGRDKDVAAVWTDFKKLGGGPAVKKEARVVYGSFLIDNGDLEEAAEVVGKAKIEKDPWPEDMRLWFVAARIAALRGDKARARHIADAIVLEDPSFPGLDDLDRLIEGG